MSTRRAVPLVLASVFALLFFGLGNYLGARQNDSDEQLAALRAEIALLKRRSPEPAGTFGHPVPPSVASMDDVNRAAIIADVKRQLQDEMGLLPLNLLRERRQEGRSDPRRIVAVKLMYKGRMLNARVIDAGDASVEVDPGDWAVVRVKEPIDLPALNINLAYGFDFADPIFRLGNDYSKGIILSTGYVGQKTPNKLVTCLTDGHPGVSGGGVLNRDGELVGIPIGRMQGDYRFSFILPLRPEMFRKVQHLN
jgi:hypothetical protein